MADERLVAALLQQELDAAQRPYFGNPNLAAQGRRANERLKEFPFTEDETSFVSVNPLMARKAEAIKRNAPAENMLTQYAQTMPQNWQQFGQNMAQAYPTPATGASRDQILGAVTQAAVNAGPLMTVYHGSPHRFDKFDASKIGTGEGAQAYGHGVYLGEAKSTGEFYRDAVSDAHGVQSNLTGAGHSIGIPKWAEGKVNEEGLSSLLKEWELRAARERSAMTKTNQPWLNENNAVRFEEEANKIRDMLKAGDAKASGGGYLYKVDLPDEQIAKMLDWDKPLNQQADLGKKISPESLGLTYKQLENGNHAFVNSEGKVLGNLQKNGSKESFTQNWIENVLRGSGRDLYNQLGQGMGGGAKVSEALQQAGITGIRYLDGGSRAGGAGTSNFVVFDPAHMNIIGRE